MIQKEIRIIIENNFLQITRWVPACTLLGFFEFYKEKIFDIQLQKLRKIDFYRKF